MSVVTRFAPSPTGSLHLGSARTALFSWLYARHYGGQFLLRLEDTDKVRSTQESAEEILECLNWLGLKWDENIVIQSQRQKRHQEIAYHLLSEGKAYACYATPQELEEMRQKALADGAPPLYDRRWRDPITPPPSNAPFAIRLKMPLEGVTRLDDLVQGSIEVSHDVLDDLVLLRNDGTPTYMLAVVVDDHDMGVTHIIRGDDHLTNAFRQIQIYRAMGWDVPHMGHIPLIHGSDGHKLSKRHGAVSVGAYKDQGILPEALLNTLMRLGWSHGDEERITLNQAIQWFDGSHLSRSAARFDEQKLLSLNAYYLRQKGASQLWNMVIQYEQIFCPALKPLLIDEGNYQAGLSILPALAQRCTTLQELSHSLRHYALPLVETPALSKDEQKVVHQFLETWSCPLDWTHDELESSMRQWTQQNQLSFGNLAKPLRLALTGQSVSPSLMDVMVALGPEQTRSRLTQALGSLDGKNP
jgi:glutamyl-tRNA synthetase